MTRALGRTAAAAVIACAALSAQDNDDAYLTWSASQAESIGGQTVRQGRVGGLFDTRLLKTERSYNYKLSATWLTPEVVKATARLAQLRSRLSEAETRTLVEEAMAIAGTVVIVDIDPREGSGVIPRDWEAFLQPKGRPDAAMRGTVTPRLRDVRALAGVRRRNYDYDRFWVVFPLRQQTTPLFEARDQSAELIVRVYNKEGHIEWPIPASIRRIAQVSELPDKKGDPPTSGSPLARLLGAGCRSAALR